MGTANSASLPGFDPSVPRINAQLGIGVGEGGGFDPDKVAVNLF